MTRALLFLAAGAIINFVVAILCAAYSRPTTGFGEVATDPSERLALLAEYPAEWIHQPDPHRPAVTIHGSLDGFGAAQTWLCWQDSSLPSIPKQFVDADGKIVPIDGVFVLQATVTSGWPCRALTAQGRAVLTPPNANLYPITVINGFDGTSTLGLKKTDYALVVAIPVGRIIPLKPIWLPFACGALAWTSPLLLVYAGLRWNRHRIGIRRGRWHLCPRCAYPVRGLSRCPECGEPCAR